MTVVNHITTGLVVRHNDDTGEVALKQLLLLPGQRTTQQGTHIGVSGLVYPHGVKGRLCEDNGFALTSIVEIPHNLRLVESPTARVGAIVLEFLTYKATTHQTYRPAPVVICRYHNHIVRAVYRRVVACASGRVTHLEVFHRGLFEPTTLHVFHSRRRSHEPVMHHVDSLGRKLLQLDIFNPDGVESLFEGTVGILPQ